MKKAPIPRLADNPDVKREREKLSQVQLELAKVEADIAHLQHARSEAVKSVNTVHAAATAILDGRPLEEVDLARLTDALSEALRKKTVLTEAVEIQRRRVRDAEQRASREVCEAAAPHYRAILQRMADAIAELCAVSAEERAFREALTDDGVAFGYIGNPMALPMFDLRDSHSRASWWLKELERDYGIKPRKA